MYNWRIAFVVIGIGMLTLLPHPAKAQWSADDVVRSEAVTEDYESGGAGVSYTNTGQISESTATIDGFDSVSHPRVRIKAKYTQIWHWQGTGAAPSTVTVGIDSSVIGSAEASIYASASSSLSGTDSKGGSCSSESNTLGDYWVSGGGYQPATLIVDATTGTCRVEYLLRSFAEVNMLPNPYSTGMDEDYYGAGEVSANSRYLVTSPY